MVNLENHLLVNILETLNQIIADPDSYDYKVEHVSGSSGAKRERMHKFVKGFSTIAYTQNGTSSSRDSAPSPTPKTAFIPRKGSQIGPWLRWFHPSPAVAEPTTPRSLAGLRRQGCRIHRNRGSPPRRLRRPRRSWRAWIPARRGGVRGATGLTRCVRRPRAMEGRQRHPAMASQPDHDPRR